MDVACTGRKFCPSIGADVFSRRPRAPHIAATLPAGERSTEHLLTRPIKLNAEVHKDIDPPSIAVPDIPDSGSRSVSSQFWPLSSQCDGPNIPLSSRDRRRDRKLESSPGLAEYALVQASPGELEGRPRSIHGASQMRWGWGSAGMEACPDLQRRSPSTSCMIPPA